MRMFTIALGLAGILTAGSAMAQAPTNQQAQSCQAQARQQVLQGEALISFMASCTAGQVAPAPVTGDSTQRCADQARMASGEAKVQAMRGCGRN